VNQTPVVVDLITYSLYLDNNYATASTTSRICWRSLKVVEHWLPRLRLTLPDLDVSSVICLGLVNESLVGCFTSTKRLHDITVNQSEPG